MCMYVYTYLYVCMNMYFYVSQQLKKIVHKYGCLHGRFRRKEKENENVLIIFYFQTLKKNEEMGMV